MGELQRSGKRLVKNFLNRAKSRFDDKNSNQRHHLVFGAPLNSDLDEIPRIVERCISYLYIHAPTTEGIFRISPDQTEVLELATRIDDGEDINFESPIVYRFDQKQIPIHVDPHVVASLLKKYFRELPEPLCTSEMYDMWMAAVSIKDRETNMSQVKKVLEFLPPANFKLINVLVAFLSDLKDFDKFTKMGTSNLSICFAPNLLRPPDSMDLAERIDESPMANALLGLLIENFDYYFQ